MSDSTGVKSGVKEWDNQHFLHPWEGMADHGNNERTFTESGQGIYVTTDTGKRLLDGPAGMWCMQLGYGNAEIADAMATQARDLAYFSPYDNTNSVSVRLSRMIAERTPGDLNQIFSQTAAQQRSIPLCALSGFATMCSGGQRKR